MSHLRDCRAEPETLGFALGNEKPLGIERIEGSPRFQCNK